MPGWFTYHHTGHRVVKVDTKEKEVCISLYSMKMPKHLGIKCTKFGNVDNQSIARVKLI